MSANVGDRIRLHANTVDTPDRTGTIVAVLGPDGPPYRVRFDSGEETIVAPGPDATIEAPGAGQRLAHAAGTAGEVAAEAAERARDAAEDVTDRAARTVSDVASSVADRLRR